MQESSHNIASANVISNWEIASPVDHLAVGSWPAGVAVAGTRGINGCRQTHREKRDNARHEKQAFS